MASALRRHGASRSSCRPPSALRVWNGPESSPSRAGYDFLAARTMLPLNVLVLHLMLSAEDFAKYSILRRTCTSWNLAPLMGSKPGQ